MLRLCAPVPTTRSSGVVLFAHIKPGESQHSHDHLPAGRGVRARPSGWPEGRARHVRPAGRKVCAGSPAAQFGANAGGHIDGCAHAYGGGVAGWFGTNAGGCE